MGSAPKFGMSVAEDVVKRYPPSAPPAELKETPDSPVAVTVTFVREPNDLVAVIESEKDGDIFAGRRGYSRDHVVRRG